MKEKLAKHHQQLLNCPPSPDQLELYGEAPRKRGYASTHHLSAEQESRLFDAVVMLAIEHTFTDGAMPNVYLFVPSRMEGWATERLRNMAQRMFAICKQQKAVKKAKLLGECFRHVLMGSRVNHASTPPDHWVAFGFEPSPDTPKWLSESVITLSPFSRDD